MPTLSNREVEVLMLIGKGFSDKEIATQLKISSRTVQTHVSRILVKLSAKNRSNAVFAYFNSNMN